MAKRRIAIERPQHCCWYSCFKRLSPRNRTSLCPYHRRLQLYIMKRRP